jgi:hypothetical protein
MWTCEICGKEIKTGEYYLSSRPQTHYKNRIITQSVKVCYVHVNCLKKAKKLASELKFTEEQLITTRKVAEANCDH